MRRMGDTSKCDSAHGICQYQSQLFLRDRSRKVLTVIFNDPETQTRSNFKLDNRWNVVYLDAQVFLYSSKRILYKFFPSYGQWWFLKKSFSPNLNFSKLIILGDTTFMASPVQEYTKKKRVAQ